MRKINVSLVKHFDSCYNIKGTNAKIERKKYVRVNRYQFYKRWKKHFKRC